MRINIRDIIDMHEDEGGLHKDESDMINAVLDLKEITVEKIMTHRKNIFSLDLNETNKIFETISKSSYSRIPVWEKNPNNILGIIHAKNILTNLDKFGKIEISKIKGSIINPWFIPETTKVKDQTSKCQKDWKVNIYLILIICAIHLTIFFHILVNSTFNNSDFT